MSEREQQIVLDHDNFLTDGDAEKPLYQLPYIEKFCELFDVSLREVENLFDESEREILAKPKKHLHRVNGLIVGPETSDHILLTLAAARLTLLKWRTNNHKEIPLDSTRDNRVFTQIYSDVYPKSGTIYRHDAARVVTDLHKTGRLTIISGSDTHHVQQKLAGLFKGTSVDVFSLDIRGNAGKSFVDLKQVTALPKYIRLNHFPYPIYLRKPVYLSILNSLPNAPGVVASDSYTYDLSLPEYLRMFTVLLKTSFITKHESDHYIHHANGIRVQTLTEMRDAIDPFV